jgi:hypothetical protein
LEDEALRLVVADNGRPVRGAQRRLEDLKWPFVPGRLLQVTQQSLNRIASMPVTDPLLPLSFELPSAEPRLRPLSRR